MNKLLTFALGLMLVFGAACAEEEPYDTPPPEDETEVQAEVQALESDIDTWLGDLDQEISQLEGELANLPEEVRADTEAELEKVRDERQDIVELRQEATMAQTPEEVREARWKIRREYQDVDALLTQARLEAAQELESFREIARTEAEELDREIEVMEAEAANLDAEARQEYDQQVAELRQEREALQQDLDQLEQATEENWQDLKTGVIEGWRSLSEAFDRVRLPDVDVDVETEEGDL